MPKIPDKCKHCGNPKDHPKVSQLKGSDAMFLFCHDCSKYTYYTKPAPEHIPTPKKKGDVPPPPPSPPKDDKEYLLPPQPPQ